MTWPPTCCSAGVDAWVKRACRAAARGLTQRVAIESQASASLAGLSAVAPMNAKSAT